MISAIVATAAPSLVMTCGHWLESVLEMSLVAFDSAEGMENTTTTI